MAKVYKDCIDPEWGVAPWSAEEFEEAEGPDEPQPGVGCESRLAALRAAIEGQQAVADANEGDEFLEGWVWGLEQALCLLFPEAAECR